MSARVFIGLDRDGGRRVQDLAHLRQSIGDILTTPLGSRVMRRDYGSRLFELIDKPLNAATRVDIYAAVAEALRKWEPRLVLKRVIVSAAAAGRLSIDLETEIDGEKVLLEGVA